MTVLVYTCVVCRRDEIPMIKHPTPGFEYRCFSDEPDRGEKKGWQVRSLARRESTVFHTVRWHKILPHIHSPGFDYYLWLDGHIAPKVDLLELVVEMFDAEICAFPHRKRSDPYQEAHAVQALKLETVEGKDYALRLLYGEKYPHGGGLHECGTLLMKNTARVRDMLNDWYATLVIGKCKRDQLHFDRLSRKHHVRVQDLDGDVRTNRYFDWTTHERPISPDTVRMQEQWEKS